MRGFAPISDYRDVRIDTGIRKAYLHGVYTGVPHLRHIRFQDEHQPELAFDGER